MASYDREKIIEIAKNEFGSMLQEQTAPSPTQQAVEMIQQLQNQLGGTLEQTLPSLQAAIEGDMEALAGINQLSQGAGQALMLALQDPSQVQALQAAMQQIQILSAEALPAAEEEAANDMEVTQILGQELAATAGGLGSAISSLVDLEKHNAEMEQKARKEQSRIETQETLGEDLEKAVRESFAIQEAFRSVGRADIYQTEPSVISDRALNFDDLYNIIRAIEGVTVVSTSAESENVSDTRQKVRLKIKFIKGPREIERYLILLRNAVKRVPEVRSMVFGRTELVADV